MLSKLLKISVMKKIIITIVSLIIVACIGCWLSCDKCCSDSGCEAQADIQWYQDTAALSAQLAQAIKAAQYPDSSKVCHNLMPISTDVPGQEWSTVDGKNMVLLVTLVDSSRLQRFFSGQGAYRIDRETGTWATIPAEWKLHADAFRGLDSVAAHMRMLQLYGLSPDCDYNIMVQFYADPDWMFRPAYTPDIRATESALDFPAYADENYRVGETNFREWFRYSLSQAYEDDSPLPWTQLGYTYDWHPGDSHVGLSEYIVTHHSLIQVKSYQSEWAFIQSLLK